jgi:hypothetical protein
MKKFNELTKSQQKKALNFFLTDLLQNIAAGIIVFNDKANGDDLQARINAAGEEADRLQTPWFIGEIIMEKCGKELTAMAQCTAEDHLYAEDHEKFVDLCDIDAVA